MHVLTENEMLLQKQQFAYKLRNLYVEDYDFFSQIVDFIPFQIHINKKDSLDIVYANEQVLTKAKELERLTHEGFEYLPQISCPALLSQAKAKAAAFSKANDRYAVCNYFQRIQVNGQMKLTYSNKLILDQSLYFNLTAFTEDMGGIGKVLNRIFEPLDMNGVLWQKFLTLTKQEKEIIRLLGKGSTSKEVGNLLFISHHTVTTHRKNIYRKLDIKNVSQLVRYALLLDLL